MSRIKKERTKSGLIRSNFQESIEGKSTALYTLTNVNGMEVAITNYGARIVSVMAPDRNNQFADVVLGFQHIADYRSVNDLVFGATIGRYANRIANGKFRLEGAEYQLEKNEGENTLHGGNSSWSHVVWTVESKASNNITLTYKSPDGEGGFPGEVKAGVSFTLMENNTLQIGFSAFTHSPTIVNLTNHSYFNLKGEGDGDIHDHSLLINATEVTEVRSGLIPTGKIISVAGTPLDFRNPRKIGAQIDSAHASIVPGSGYDHNFVLNKTMLDTAGLSFAARVQEPRSGRMLEVWTTQPGLQFYSGNWLGNNAVGKCGSPFERRGAFCLEPQHFPDAPNQPSFPDTTLYPPQEYHHICEYRFLVD